MKTQISCLIFFGYWYGLKFRFSHIDALYRYDSEGGRYRLFQYCCWSSTRRSISSKFLIISQNYIARTSIDLIKENGFTFKKGKKQTILRGNSNGRTLYRWSSTSYKNTYPSQIPAAYPEAGGLRHWPPRGREKTEYMCFKREGAPTTLNEGPLKLDKFTWLINWKWCWNTLCKGMECFGQFIDLSYEKNGISSKQRLCQYNSMEEPHGRNNLLNTNCTATFLPSLNRITVRRKIHAGHFWRIKDDFISDYSSLDS